MASSRRIYFQTPAVEENDVEYIPPFTPVPTAKLIEFLPPKSLLCVAFILGDRFGEVIRGIESQSAA